MDIPTSSSYAMVPMADALARIAAALDPLPPEPVPTQHSLHRIVAEDIRSPASLPPFRASVKDGYALSYASTNVEPPETSFAVVTEESHAGGEAPPQLPPGQAAYVTTGAPVPPGTHAVVMVEHCSRDRDTLLVPRPPPLGADIRDVGSDVRAGDLVLAKGTFIGAAEIGILSSCFVASVHVYARPVVGVLSTGDELLDVQDVLVDPHALPFGKIIDSNRPMLLAAIRESLPFCECVDLGRRSDDRAGIRAALEAATAQCHVVVTSGGVSMGKRDAIKPVLEDMATVHFGRVVMKPGKPLTFATMGRAHCVVGLPGNPVSCFVCFHLAVAVAARRLAGWDQQAALGKKIEAILSEDIRLDPQRPEYHRATVQWVEGKGFLATSTGKQASSRLLSARSADVLLALPAEDRIMKAGTKVPAYLLTNYMYM